MNQHRPTRVDPVDPEQLTPDQQVVADRIAGTRGFLPGPFTALLHVPELADLVQSLGAYLRYRGGLDRDLAEAAILVAAHRWGSAYAWNAHAPIGRRAGIPEDVITRIETGADFDALPSRYRVVCEFARELVASGRVSDDAYAMTVASLGVPGAIELTVLVGYYSLVSMTLNALGWQLTPISSGHL
jgi:4-carboxymuconolactone decarboxylase